MGKFLRAGSLNTNCVVLDSVRLRAVMSGRGGGAQKLISSGTVLQKQIFFHCMSKVIKVWTWNLLNFAPFYKTFVFHFRILVQCCWTIILHYHISVAYRKKANILTLYVITFLYAKSPVHYDSVATRIVITSGEISAPYLYF